MNFTLSLKIKAGALQFVVFIGTLIAILLLAFVALTHTHTLFEKQALLTIQTTKHNNNQIQALMAKGRFESLPDKGIEKTYWGVFEKLKVTTTTKKNAFSKIALIGGHTASRDALYLKENNQPLIVVGHTIIRGKAYLPKQSVKPGNIAGNAYFGTQLIYGEKRLSNTNLPKPENFSYLNQINEHTTKAVSLTLTARTSNYTNSFFEKTQMLFDHTRIDLSGLKFFGNIIIQSESSIYIDQTTKLHDVLLIAPKIEIGDGFSGNFQAIATASITIGKNCELTYPSALILNTDAPGEVLKNDTQLANHIYLGEASSVKGIISYINPEQQKGFKPQIIIEKQAKVYGELYCDAYLELKGSIFGSVYTSGFITQEAGSIYINHILNGEIDSSELHPNYVGLNFNNKKEVAKWLY